MFLLTIKSDFSAAHLLPGYEGNCNNMHGHTWEVETVYAIPNQIQQNDETGIAIDFKALKAALNQILALFDHSILNQIIPIPTAENLAVFIHTRLATEDLTNSGPYLQSVTVHEARDAKVTYFVDESEV